MGNKTNEEYNELQKLVVRLIHNIDIQIKKFDNIELKIPFYLKKYSVSGIKLNLKYSRMCLNNAKEYLNFVLFVLEEGSGEIA